MCVAPSTTVVPSETRPAITSAAPPRRSGACTIVPESRRGPRMSALWPPNRSIPASRRFNSSATRSLGEQDHHLGLKVGREAREGQCCDVYPAERRSIFDPHPDTRGARGGDYLHPHLPQLLELHLQVLGEGVRYRDVPAGRSRGHQERTRLDTVRHHRPLGGVQFTDAFDHYAARARSHDARAHRIEEAGEGGDLRLAGAVLDSGDPIREHGSHHDVLGCADARVLEVDLSGPQPAGGARLYEAVVELDVSAERPQAVDVKVELPQAEITPARRRDLGLAETRHERAE